jgi:Sec-independent protein translocase protein TatA
MAYEMQPIRVAIGDLPIWAKRLLELARSLGKDQSEYKKARIQAKKEFDSVTELQTIDAAPVGNNQSISNKAELEEIASKIESETQGIQMRS